MYNGYNYYPPNGSTSTSPVYLMPYPYQYDPFFMTPGGVEPVDGDENSEDKVEPEGTKENNQQAEIHNVSFYCFTDGAIYDNRKRVTAVRRVQSD